MKTDRGMVVLLTRELKYVEAILFFVYFETKGK